VQQCKWSVPIHCEATRLQYCRKRQKHSNWVKHRTAEAKSKLFLDNVLWAETEHVTWFSGRERRCCVLTLYSRVAVVVVVVTNQLLLLLWQVDYMTGRGELVEHGWLDNFLDAQTTSIASGTRPTRTTTTNTTSVLHAVEQHHHNQQQQQQPQRVHSEHSYSLDNDNDNGDVDFNIKIDPDEHGACSSTLRCGLYSSNRCDESTIYLE